MPDNNQEIRELRRDINVLEDRLKHAKQSNLSASQIEQLQKTKRRYEDKLKEAQAKSKHWYYR